MYKTLSVSQKKLIIKRVLAGEKITHVAKEAGVSRTILYKWIRELKQAGSLHSGIKKGRAHYRAFDIRTERLIVRTALRNPQYSPKKMKELLHLSGNGIWTVLKRYNLNTKQAREQYIQRSGRVIIPERTTEERLTAIRRREAGDKIAGICRDFKISRTIFYKWLAKYEAGQKEKQALSSIRPKGDRHWKYIPGIEQEILKVVVDDPGLSAHKITKTLREQAGKNIVGHNCVHTILKKLNLNTYDKRMAYAESKKQAGTFVPVLPEVQLPAVPRYSFTSFLSPPSKRTFYTYFKYFTAVSSSTFLIALILIVVINAFSSAGSVMAGIGMFFALVSLAFGFFFFLYSLKYYLSVAIVLSWSRRKDEEVREKGWKGFLANLFGISISIEDETISSGEAKSSFVNATAGKAVGLRADLSNVVLDCQPFVSIHLSTYNEKKVIDRLLTAATSMDYQNYEVVVADDSTDETVDLLKRWEHHPRVRISHRETREGYKGGALREALKVTDPKAEFILVFDADFIPYPDTIVQFLKYFQASAGTLDFKQESGIRNKELGNELNNKNHNSSFLIHNSNIAAVQGYQWHVLNKSENWITRGVRSEYSGSYVIERSGEEIYRGLKQISGSVYMIRKDVLESIGWGTSITEDFELTLRLYEKGFKVVYTPYIQAPAEAVSTIKRLIRQRMRWAEGHSFNVKRMFMRLMWGRRLKNVIARSTTIVGDEAIRNGSAQAASDTSITGLLRRPEFTERAPRNDVFVPSPLTFSEKLEFLYLSPYYLQAAFFIAGSLSWFLSEMVFRVRLPFWTETLGWSLVLTNLFALPLMNMIGMFMEESDEKDYLGLFSFVLLSYIVAPFQAFASVKGFLEKEEGPWFRTPKTGRITDSFVTGRISKFVKSLFGKGTPVIARAAFDAAESSLASLPLSINYTGSSLQGGMFSQNPYLALATANNRFDADPGQRRKGKWTGKGIMATFLLLVMMANYLTFFPAGNKAEAAWFNSSYLYKKQIIINHAYVNTTGEATTNLTNFPVLITVNSDANLATVANGGKVQNSNGYDIIFTESTETTQLDHEIEAYNATTGQIMMWVRVSAVSSVNDTTIWMYYDNSSISTSQENASGTGKTWDSNYKGVWHLKESGNGTAGEYKDSTSNANNGRGGAGNSTKTPTQATGQIGYGQNFNVTNSQWIIDNATTGLGNFNSNQTIFFWYKVASNPSTHQHMIDTPDTPSSGNGNQIEWCSATDLGINDGGCTGELVAITPPAAGAWHLLTWTWNGTNEIIYTDGAQNATSTTAPPSGTAIHEITMGAYDSNGSPGSPYNGLLDEVEFSSTARSAGWIATEYNNQNSPSTFETISSYRSGYLYKKAITINHSQVNATGDASSPNLTNFPVLISETSDTDLKSAANAGKVQSSSGYDIIFMDANETTKLDHEIEKYVASTGEIEMWVRIPTLSTLTDTVIYMYYDNSNISTSQENKTGVWDSNYKGVWHLSESGNGTAGEYKDSKVTNNLTGGEGNATVAPLQTTGMIGYGQNFNSATYRWAEINGTSGLPALNATQTDSFWYNIPANPGSEEIIFDTQDTIGDTNGDQIEFTGTGNLAVTNSAGAPGGTIVQMANPTNNTWHMITWTRNGSTNRLYKDGVEQANTTTSPQNAANNLLVLGNCYSGANQGHVCGPAYKGLLDEVHISNTARSAGWVVTEYNNQNNPGTGSFLTIGSGQTMGWYDTGYLYRKTITINHSQVNTTGESNTNLTNFPFLISLTSDADLALTPSGKVQSSSGYDIVFTDLSNIKLDHEIEQYSTNGTIAMWVRIPALSSVTDTSIYMYYDNSAVTTSQENKTGVWNSNYMGVWHMAGATGATQNDSTNSYNMSQSGSPVQMAGKIDGSINFSGSNYLSNATPTNLNFNRTDSYTLSFWAKPNDHNNSAALGHSLTSGNYTGYIFFLNASAGGDTQTTGSIEFQFLGSNSDGIDVNTTSNSAKLNDGSWHLYELTYNGSSNATGVKLYEDGTSLGLTITSNNLASSTKANIPFEIGEGQDTYNLNGGLDEVRASNATRSAGWIWTEYNNQNTPSGTYNVGSGTGQSGISPNAPSAIEQQINIMDQVYTTSSSSDDPGDNSLGEVYYDGAKYTSPTVYFEAVMKLLVGGSTNVSATLYYSDNGTAVSSSTVTTTNTSAYQRVRSGALTLANTTNYTVRIKCGSANTGCGSVDAARLIVLQSAAGGIQSTETQIEVGNNETTMAVSNTTLTDPKLYTYNDSKFSPSPTAYFEATMKSSNSNDTGSAGPTYSTAAGDAVNDTTNGTVAWNRANRVIAKDGVTANVTMTSTAISYYIRSTNFSFSVTPTAVIDGITANITRRASVNGNSTDYYRDYKVYLVTGGVIRDSLTNYANTTNWTNANVSAIYGGAADTWGVSGLTGADVNGTNNFGIVISVNKLGAGTTSEIARIDSISLTINYHIVTTKTVYAELYNANTAAPLAASTISLTSTSWTRVRSGAISADANWNKTTPNQYYVRISTSNASATGYISNAKLVFDQSDPGGVLKLQTAQQYVNTLTTSATGAYVSQQYPNSFNSSNFQGVSFTQSYEATMKSLSGTAYTQLYNTLNSSAVAGSEITTTNSAYTQVTSGSLTMTNITSDMDAQEKGDTVTPALDNSNSTHQEGGASSNPTILANFTTANYSNRLMIVGVTRNSIVNVNNVTYGSSNLTQLKTVNTSTAVEDDIWYLKNPPVQTANITVSFSSQVQTVIGVSTFYNVDQSVNTFGTVASVNNSSTSPSNISVTSATGELVIDSFGAQDAVGTLWTVNASQSQLYLYAKANEKAGGGSTKAGASTVNMVWTCGASCSDWWADIGVSIRPSTNSASIDNSWLLIDISDVVVPENLLLLIPLIFFLPKLVEIFEERKRKRNALLIFAADKCTYLSEQRIEAGRSRLLQ